MRRSFLAGLVVALAIGVVVALAVALEHATAQRYPSAFAFAWVAGVAGGVAFVVYRLVFEPARAALEHLHATGDYHGERDRARHLFERLLRDRRTAARVKHALLLRRLRTAAGEATIDTELEAEIQRRMTEIHSLVFAARCREVSRQTRLWERLVHSVETAPVSPGEKADLMRDVERMMAEEIDGLAEKSWEYAPQRGEEPVGPVTTNGLVKLMKSRAFRENARIREVGAGKWTSAGKWLLASSQLKPRKSP